MATATRRTSLHAAGAEAMAARVFGGSSPAAATSAVQASPAQKPNILFMLVDNLGYGGVECLR